MNHFSRTEFACRCGCGFDTVDYELVEILDLVREFFSQPTTITSACRCRGHNNAVGGTAGSLHLVGRAADIQVERVPPEAVADFVATLNPGGLGRYKTFTHVDTRTSHKARWGHN